MTRVAAVSKVIVISLTLAAGACFAQQLTIQLESGKQVVMNNADIRELPQLKVSAGAGAEAAVYEGASLQAVLDKAGVPFGHSLSGKRMTLCLFVEAADGYKAVFALPELDADFSAKQFLLATSKNGEPLEHKEGPYRIVVPEEKRMARWIRQVTAMRIVNAQ